MRVLVKCCLVAALVGAVLLLSVVPAVAATPVSNGHADYYHAKAMLNADKQFVRTVTVSGDTRTFTYTSASGLQFVLAEPVNRSTPGIQPQLQIVGCGWFDVCLRLNRTDQTIILAGGAAFIIGAACAIPVGGWLGCGAISAGVTIAAGFLAAYGLCSNTLQVGLLPPGRDLACW